MERDRQTSSGISIESRIQSETTLFFELSEKERAYVAARELGSYVYDCFEDVEREINGHKRSFLERTGFCVPK